MAKKTIKLSENNTHWKNLFDYDFLGSHNLLPGEELVAKIIKIVDEEVASKKKKKGEEKQILPIIYFEGKVPKMVLNKTNASTIAKLYSPYTDKWIGKYVQIFATDVNAFGETVSALRIRDVMPDINELVDVKADLAVMEEFTTGEQLKEFFFKLSSEKQRHPDIIALKDKLKSTLK